MWFASYRIVSIILKPKFSPVRLKQTGGISIGTTSLHLKRSQQEKSQICGLLCIYRATRGVSVALSFRVNYQVFAYRERQNKMDQKSSMNQFINGLQCIWSLVKILFLNSKLKFMSKALCISSSMDILRVTMAYALLRFKSIYPSMVVRISIRKL